MEIIKQEWEFTDNNKATAIFKRGDNIVASIDYNYKLNEFNVNGTLDDVFEPDEEFDYSEYIKILGELGQLYINKIYK